MAKITEYCAKCEREVKIDASPYVLQKCPHCGAPIRACSLCDCDIVNCKKCQKKYKEVRTVVSKHYYVTGDRFTNEQRKVIKEAGFFVYSLRSWDTGDGSQLEHRVIVNHEGDVITNFKALPDEPDAFEPDFYQYMENQGATDNYKTFESVLKTIEQ